MVMRMAPETHFLSTFHQITCFCSLQHLHKCLSPSSIKKFLPQTMGKEVTEIYCDTKEERERERERELKWEKGSPVSCEEKKVELSSSIPAGERNLVKEVARCVCGCGHGSRCVNEVTHTDSLAGRMCVFLLLALIKRQYIWVLTSSKYTVT